MFGQSGYNADNLASDDEEYTIAKNVAATPPRQSKRTANLLTVWWLNLYLKSELLQNWGQSIPNLIHHHVDPTEISRICWILDITDWFHQQEEMHS